MPASNSESAVNCLSGPADEKKNETQMGKISAVSSRVSHREIHDGFEKSFARSQGSRPCAFIKLSIMDVPTKAAMTRAIHA